ncbi:MAG: hypothetical protein H6713_29730 [Myxococcales bacterium]|nr:hypothetical protein [Myxococcales bacterium]
MTTPRSPRRCARQSGALWPALTEAPATAGASRTLGHVLSDTGTCARCHPDAAAQWRTSAHALASFNNPIYRASIERFRARAGAEASRACAGCHDPALLVDGVIDGDVRPDDARAHAGVSCRTCHGIDDARNDGNGSYTLRADTTHDEPDPDDAASVAAHRRAQASASLGSAAMCGACHRAFLGPATGHPHHLAGADDLGPWLASSYAGSDGARVDEALPQRDCRGCHMPREAATRGDLAAADDGTIVSHRASRAATPGSPRWPATRSSSRVSARGSSGPRPSTSPPRASRGQGWARPAENLSLAAGDDVLADVVIFNRDVGHHFPGGTRDAQDTWIELELRDRAGRLLAREDEGERHVLRALVAGEDGEPRDAREVEDFRAVVVDLTVAPRDAVVVRYEFTVPAGLAPDAWPLRVDARLRHRSRISGLVRETCRDGQTRAGRAIARASARLGRPTLDPCAAAPVTEIASASLWLERGASTSSSRVEHGPGGARPTWTRLYQHGLALLHRRQEHLDEAAESLAAALEVAPSEHARAQILAAQTQLAAAARGRVDEARALAAQALELTGPHPRPRARARGHARADLADRGGGRAARHAHLALPARSDAVGLARADAGRQRGRPRRARGGGARARARAPRRGPAARPGARACGRGHAAAADARAAYLDHRAPDQAPRVRSRCAQQLEACARERVPVHVHALRPVTGRSRR